MAAKKLLILYSDEKLVKSVSRCTDHESVIGFWKFWKLKMAYPIWRQKYFLFYILLKNWLRGFLGALITNLSSDFENFDNWKWRIQYGGQNTFFISCWKIRQGGFLGRWSRIWYRIFAISKIKNGRPNMAADKLLALYSDEKLVKGVSWCTYHEYAIGFWKFWKLKMAVPIWRPKYFFLYPDGKFDKGVSWGADRESGIEFLPFQKLKMVDPIWPIWGFAK